MPNWTQQLSSLVYRAYAMRYYRIFFLCAIPCALFSAQGRDRDTDRGDLPALRQWIASKRFVSTRVLQGDLTLSGNVRYEYATVNDTKNGNKYTGPCSCMPLISDTPFKIEYHFLFDYRTERTWAAGKVRLDNRMGAVFGTFDRLRLERAFCGYRIAEGDNFLIDLVIGRQRIDWVYDSRLMYASILDGILLKWDYHTPEYGDIYWHGSPFVIDDITNHYGLVWEAGWLQLLQTGFYFRYSLIDWQPHYPNQIDQRCCSLDAFRFQVGQLLIGWQGIPKFLNKRVTFHAAFLQNYAARLVPHLLGDRLANLGYYGGFRIGNVVRAGDWMVDVMIQYAEPQVLPDFDANGIHNGNAERIGLYTRNLNGTGPCTTRCDAIGSNNFFGFRINLFYSISNNFSVVQDFQYSYTLDYLPTRLTFKRAKLEFVYAY